MRTLVRLLAVVIFVLLSGCSDTTPPTGTGHATYWPDDPDAQWRASYIRGMFHLEGNVTLSFDSSSATIHGIAGCNEYLVILSHPAEGQTVAKMFVLTELLCGEELMETEEAFVDAVKRMRYLQITGDRLYVRSADHRKLVIFGPNNDWPGPLPGVTKNSCAADALVCCSYERIGKRAHRGTHAGGDC